jgi:hypothetical protein
LPLHPKAHRRSAPFMSTTTARAVPLVEPSLDISRSGILCSHPPICNYVYLSCMRRGGHYPCPILLRFPPGPSAGVAVEQHRRLQLFPRRIGRALSYTARQYPHPLRVSCRCRLRAWRVLSRRTCAPVGQGRACRRHYGGFALVGGLRLHRTLARKGPWHSFSWAFARSGPLAT